MIMIMIKECGKGEVESGVKASQNDKHVLDTVPCSLAMMMMMMMMVIIVVIGDDDGHSADDDDCRNYHVSQGSLKQEREKLVRGW